MDVVIDSEPKHIYRSLHNGDNIAMTEKTSCPYCGEEFESDDDQDAITKEGIHRAEEHVNDETSTKKANKGNNIVNKWKSEGKRA